MGIAAGIGAAGVRNELVHPGQVRNSFLRWTLLLAPGVMLLGALSGAIAGETATNPWFAALAKPALSPSLAAFGLAWGILLPLTGLAAAVVAAARGAYWRKTALVVFAVQLVLALAWRPLFFAAHQITQGLAVLVALDLAVLATIVLFNRVRPAAAAMMLPYLAWLLFLTLLTWQFMTANPHLDGQPVSGAVTRVTL